MSDDSQQISNSQGVAQGEGPAKNKGENQVKNQAENQNKRIPTPEEIRKEFENFARDRFGPNVQFVAQPMGVNGINHEAAPKTEAPESSQETQLNWDFDWTPKQVKEYLDRFVIKQDDAKKALAIAVCDHYNHVKACFENPDLSSRSYSKQNVMMLGPTGVGKTYLIRQVAKLIGVPFVKADATRFTETGYVGANVDDLIRDLVAQADGDIKKAQYGIIYLDEADKLASPVKHGGRDVSGRGVQFGLLKIMEESEVDLRSGNDISSQIQTMMEFQQKGKVEKKLVNTRHILFIVSGAFTGLKEIIQKRLDQRAIGITADVVGGSEAEDNYKFATTQDFIDFGFEPEFVGRLPIRVSCEHLEAEDLFDILKDSEESILKQYEGAFKAYGIKVRFEDPALKKIAELASQEKTGARALMTVCERLLRDFKFELPSSAVTEFVVNEELVSDPAAELHRLIKENPGKAAGAVRSKIRKFEREFFEKHKLKIIFTQQACEEIALKIEESGQSVEEVCEELLRGSEHGLNLVRQNTGQTEFELNEDIVRAPKRALEKMVTESYGE